MDEIEEIKRLLKKNLEVSEESLKIAKKVRRTQNTGRLFKALKWIIILALALGSYYYIQPFLETFWQTVGDIKGDISSLKDTGQSIKDMPVSTLERIQGFFSEQ